MNLHVPDTLSTVQKFLPPMLLPRVLVARDTNRLKVLTLVAASPIVIGASYPPVCSAKAGTTIRKRESKSELFPDPVLHKSQFRYNNKVMSCSKVIPAIHRKRLTFFLMTPIRYPPAIATFRPFNTSGVSER